MKTLLPKLLAVLMILVLFTPVAPLQAGPVQDDVSGLWQYQPFILSVRTAGCNTFMTTFENGLWTGTFEGMSTEDGQVVIHCSGAWSFNAIVSFSQLTVDGRSGTLEMSVVGTRPNGEADWAGKWTILGGTGELASLHGQGTWWGPGAPAPEEWGDIYYAGKIHFDP